MRPIDLGVLETGRKALLDRVRRESGEDPASCYQCGTCSAGCPLSFALDYQPRQIMRLLQLGLGDEALRSRTIWLCASCATCSARCPRGIDVARVMDSLRIIAGRDRLPVKEPTVKLFNKIFLASVQAFGRLHEMALAGLFNAFSLQPFKDMEHVPSLVRKGKLSPLPHRVKGIRQVRAIFRRARRLEEVK